MSPRRYAIAAGTILALAVLLILPSLGHGLGLHADTGHYFAFAKSGCTVDLPTYHAPLYAVLLRVAVWLTHLTVRQAALLINLATMLSATALILFGFRRYYGHTALAAGLLFAVSYPVVYNHAWAMSEPLFFVFLLALAAALLRNLETANPGWALAAGSAAALAFLTRYAGTAFLLSGALVVFIGTCWNTPRRRWLRDWLAYGLPALALILPFYFWNISRSGSGLHRYFNLNPVTAETYYNGLATFSEWLMPYRLFQWLGLVPAGLLAAAGLAGIVVIAIRALRRRQPVMLVPALLAALYFLFVNVSIRLSDMQTPLDHRILAPFYILLLLLLAGLLAPHVRTHPRACLLLWLYLLALNGLRDRAFLATAHAQGLGVASSKWDRNPLLDFVVAAARDRTIYSNAPEVVNLLTDVGTVRWIPYTKNMYTRQDNPAFLQQCQALADDLARNRALIVYFRTKHASDAEIPDYLPTASRLQEITGAVRTRDDAYGIVLEIPPPATP